jgi:hypothetical protein
MNPFAAGEIQRSFALRLDGGIEQANCVGDVGGWSHIRSKYMNGGQIASSLKAKAVLVTALILKAFRIALPARYAELPDKISVLLNVDERERWDRDFHNANSEKAVAVVPHATTDAEQSRYLEVGATMSK